MKIFLIIGILILASVLSFGFANYHCWQEKKSFENELDSLRKDRDNLNARYKQMEEDFEKFKVWRTFIHLQQDLDRIDEEINKLNFGNAAQQMDRLNTKLRSQDLEPQYAKHLNELQTLLEQSKQELMRKNEYGARAGIVKFNRRFFEILSGVSPLQNALENLAPAQTQESQTQPQS